MLITTERLAERKEHPILFSGEMVRAILDGRKTHGTVFGPGPYLKVGTKVDDPWVIERGLQETRHRVYPRVQVGDHLWVRETWGTMAMHEILQHTFRGRPIPDYEAVVYRAGRRVHRSEDAPDDYDHSKWPMTWVDDRLPDSGKWKHSIHMPRWASRITLDVTGVRVERVQDISGPECMSKGLRRSAGLNDGPRLDEPLWIEERHRFAALWDSFNAKRGYSWESNPRVWVVEFERLKRNVDAN